MKRRLKKVSSLLQCVQEATRSHQTNAYQIAKATGLPLRSVQKLLKQNSNPTLRNIEVILSGFGLTLFLHEGGKRSIKRRKHVPKHEPSASLLSRPAS